jgi:hypothetical protein
MVAVTPAAIWLTLVSALAHRPAVALDAHSWQLNSSFLTSDYPTGLLVQTLQGLANRAAAAGVGLAPLGSVKVILAPPCIFHS